VSVNYVCLWKNLQDDDVGDLTLQIKASREISKVSKNRTWKIHPPLIHKETNCAGQGSKFPGSGLAHLAVCPRKVRDWF